MSEPIWTPNKKEPCPVCGTWVELTLTTPDTVSTTASPTPPAPMTTEKRMDDDEPCEGCGKPSVTADSDGIPLCRECADACDHPSQLRRELNSLRTIVMRLASALSAEPTLSIDYQKVIQDV